MKALGIGHKNVRNNLFLNFAKKMAQKYLSIRLRTVIVEMLKSTDVPQILKTEKKINENVKKYSFFSLI